MRKLIIRNLKLKIKDSIKRSSIFNFQSLMKSSKGLTLLEIAISMAILAIALVSLANLFPIGLRASRRAVNYSSASILAQRVIDNIKIAASTLDDSNDGVDEILNVVFTNGDGIGYFELANPNFSALPFFDNHLVVTDGNVDINGFRTYILKYDDTEDTAYVKSVDWNANGNQYTGREDPLNIDWDDVLLSQKVYVAIYWTEMDRERADTFITYISNPFYEKYR